MGRDGRSSIQPLIRSVLREEPDGLTAAELAHRVMSTPTSVNNSLRAMPDTYIDRWAKFGHQQPYSAVWCIVDVPEDCPHPTKGQKADEE